jgi:hypothetical protein
MQAASQPLHFISAKLAAGGACLNAGQPGILRFLKLGGIMDSSSPAAKWTPYEVKAASITYERRSEDLKLENLRVRLQKKMREAEDQTSKPTAA